MMIMIMTLLKGMHNAWLIIKGTQLCNIALIIVNYIQGSHSGGGMIKSQGHLQLLIGIVFHKTINKAYTFLSNMG